jgi:hypothetical protein
LDGRRSLGAFLEHGFFNPASSLLDLILQIPAFVLTRPKLSDSILGEYIVEIYEDLDTDREVAVFLIGIAMHCLPSVLPLGILMLELAKQSCGLGPMMFSIMATACLLAQKSCMSQSFFSGGEMEKLLIDSPELRPPSFHLRVLFRYPPPCALSFGRDLHGRWRFGLRRIHFVVFFHSYLDRVKAGLADSKFSLDILICR